LGHKNGGQSKVDKTKLACENLATGWHDLATGIEQGVEPRPLIQRKAAIAEARERYTPSSATLWLARSTMRTRVLVLPADMGLGRDAPNNRRNRN